MIAQSILPGPCVKLSALKARLELFEKTMVAIGEAKSITEPEVTILQLDWAVSNRLPLPVSLHRQGPSGYSPNRIGTGRALG